MDKEMAKALYENRFFYEIVKTENENELKLVGPLDTIRYTVPLEEEKNGYRFVQIIDGKIVQAFKEHEILVTMRKL